MIPWLNMRLMPYFQRLMALSSLRSESQSSKNSKNKLITNGINMTTDTARAELNIQVHSLLSGS